MINWGLKKSIIDRYGSQVNFSLEIRRPRSYVSEIVRGIRRLSDEEKLCWARVLDVDPGLIDPAGETVLTGADQRRSRHEEDGA